MWPQAGGWLGAGQGRFTGVRGVALVPVYRATLAKSSGLDRDRGYVLLGLVTHGVLSMASCVERRDTSGS